MWASHDWAIRYPGGIIMIDVNDMVRVKEEEGENKHGHRTD